MEVLEHESPVDSVDDLIAKLGAAADIANPTPKLLSHRVKSADLNPRIRFAFAEIKSFCYEFQVISASQNYFRASIRVVGAVMLTVKA